MVSEIVVERAAQKLAEIRVPGSTSAGGQYHLSESWRAMLRRNARAAAPDPDAVRIVEAVVAGPASPGASQP